MDLNFTEEQDLLRATVRELLERHSSPEIVRSLEDTAEGFNVALWRELGALDLVGLTVPTEHGGSGMGALEHVVLYEELGRALAATPHLTTAVLGGGLLAHGGTVEQQAAWLPLIARGQTILTLAWYEPHRGEGPRGVQATAKPDGDGYRLSGTKIRVPLASSADSILTLARTGQDDDDVDVFLVDPKAAGIELAQTLVLGSDAEYEVTFDDVDVPAEARLGPGEHHAWAAFESALVDVHLAVGAYASGAARRALEMAVAYAREREQFGKPIGSFQGLAHPIADMATEVTGAETLVRQAAWRRGEGRELGPLAAMAKHYACDVFKRTTKVAQQVFGGVGFTRVMDIQLYFRRAKQLELTWSGPATLGEVIASAELDAETAWVSVDAGV